MDCSSYKVAAVAVKAAVPHSYIRKGDCKAATICLQCSRCKQAQEIQQ